METEPIDSARIAALGWTSRSGVVTQHQIMENYRLTERGTLIFGVRRLERGTSYPLPQDKTPDPVLVQELTDAFHARFPSLADVKVARAWGGWIAITSSWISFAGAIGENVYYSCCCNGHGLAQAPYVGSLIADHIVRRHDARGPRVPPAQGAEVPAVHDDGHRRTSHDLGVDRLGDLFNGHKRRARRAAAVAGPAASAPAGASTRS